MIHLVLTGKEDKTEEESMQAPRNHRPQFDWYRSFPWAFLLAGSTESFECFPSRFASTFPLGRSRSLFGGDEWRERITRSFAENRALTKPGD